ncbi:hypothetical protein C8J57DRAFT_1469225 [Mycena rebaudengoi]|nr:hypothetical protein C8J57DRAFT_1469225 [Mycena rebaudengoi]
MPLSIQGSQVTFDGGTFNEVAGNMNQTITMVVSHQRTDGPLISSGDPDDDQAAPARTKLSRRIVRPRVHSSAPYSRSQRPHEYHSQTGIEPADERIGQQHFDAPESTSLTRPHATSQHDLHPLPPHSPTRSVSHIPASQLDVVPAVLRMNREGTFNSVQGNMTHTSITSYGESGIDILYRHVVTSALHDSGERFDEPACHPGTRSEILSELRDWSLDDSPEASPLLWLYGSAGAGKSAIAQEFAGRCHKDGQLGGSFFFERVHAQRGTWHSLLATLAYQLAMFSSEVRAAIQQIMEADKLLVGRALSVQFNRLFVPALKQIPSLRPLPVILIDGLDECEDHRLQTQILRLLIGAIREQQVPIRLLIVSRPEPHLRDVLGNTPDICRHLELSADSAAYEDIGRYLCDEFARICREHSSSGIILESSWPPQRAVDHLVSKSSGMFIYATTVIRFIDDEYFHPNDRLESVLRLDPQSTTPLDDLYTQILSSGSHNPMLLRILHAALSPKLIQPNPEDIDLLLALSPGTARLCLRGLHSILRIPPPCRGRFRTRQVVDVLHASLHDYFLDSRRSGPWCLSLLSLHSAFAQNAVHVWVSPFKDRVQKSFYM